MGAAYRSGDAPWSCPVEALGLKKHIVDITGMDAWQAVQLSFRLLSDIASHFVEQGGQLFWPDS